MLELFFGPLTAMQQVHVQAVQLTLELPQQDCLLRGPTENQITAAVRKTLRSLTGIQVLAFGTTYPRVLRLATLRSSPNGTVSNSHHFAEQKPLQQFQTHQRSPTTLVVQVVLHLPQLHRSPLRQLRQLDLRATTQGHSRALTQLRFRTRP